MKSFTLRVFVMCDVDDCDAVLSVDLSGPDVPRVEWRYMRNDTGWRFGVERDRCPQHAPVAAQR